VALVKTTKFIQNKGEKHKVGVCIVMMTIKQRTIENENLLLCEGACKSADCKGRDSSEPDCALRTDFQRDRDRIIHCEAFRRLKHKTQVFLLPESDHHRTRLTHTLEVAQIARTIARALRLNEDLTEAIALGHDLGHTPFGHDGEMALNQSLLDDGVNDGFEHSRQSVRVVEVIERLNLTVEVRDGILNHSSGTVADTLEGNVVRLSDKIAYINHDIEDAVDSKVITNADLPEYAVRVLGNSKSKRIDSLINSVVKSSDGSSKGVIRYDDETQRAHDELREFMFKQVYKNSRINTEKEKAAHVVKYLYGYYKDNLLQMEKPYQDLVEQYGERRAVCDYISGMTDNFAIDRFVELCVPKAWKR